MRQLLRRRASANIVAGGIAWLLCFAQVSSTQAEETAKIGTDGVTDHENAGVNSLGDTGKGVSRDATMDIEFTPRIEKFGHGPFDFAIDGPGQGKFSGAAEAEANDGFNNGSGSHSLLTEGFLLKLKRLKNIMVHTAPNPTAVPYTVHNHGEAPAILIPVGKSRPLGLFDGEHQRAVEEYTGGHMNWRRWLMAGPRFQWHVSRSAESNNIGESGFRVGGMTKYIALHSQGSNNPDPIQAGHEAAESAEAYLAEHWGWRWFGLRREVIVKSSSRTLVGRDRLAHRRYSLRIFGLTIRLPWARGVWRNTEGRFKGGLLHPVAATGHLAARAFGAHAAKHNVDRYARRFDLFMNATDRFNPHTARHSRQRANAHH